MATLHDILLAIGRIEGELVEIRKLSQRVSMLELWQSRLKGAWAVLAAMCVYLSRAVCGR